MVRFLTLTHEGRVVKATTLTREAIVQCPHRIWDIEHYREDGTCKCNDPNEKVMREWGYKWESGQWR